MKLFVAFVATLAAAHSAVIVKEPFERTSVVGPSGSITQEKNLPLVPEPVLKVAQPAAVLSEAVPVPATISEPVAVAKVETVAAPIATPVIPEVPVYKSVAAPIATPVVHSDLPLYKTVATIAPGTAVVQDYPYYPYTYGFGYPYYRTYDPSFGYYPYYAY